MFISSRSQSIFLQDSFLQVTCKWLDNPEVDFIAT